MADPTVGDEIGKTRPCVIVNNDEMGVLRLKVIVPITSWNRAFTEVPWLVKVTPSLENGLTKLSAVDTFQIRSVAQQRLIKKIGKLDDLNNGRNSSIFNNSFKYLKSLIFISSLFVGIFFDEKMRSHSREDRVFKIVTKTIRVIILIYLQ